MNSKFGLAFFISVLVCLLMAFSAGFLLAKFRETRLEETLLKKSVKLDSVFLLKQLDKKKNFLIQSAKQIRDQKNLSPPSPFFALVVFHQSQVKDIYVADEIPPGIMSSQNESPPAVKKQNKEVLSSLSERKNTIIELSKIVSSPIVSEGFQFKILENGEEKQPLVFFIRVFSKNKRYIAFLKDNKDFFKLSSPSPENNNRGQRALFVVNQKGRIFFHNKSSKVFKKLSKKSPIWKSLEEMADNQIPRGRYLKSRKTAGDKEMYYLQKWKGSGDTIFVSKTVFSPAFFLSEDYYLASGILCFVIFALFFVLFWFKFSSLVSAYKFLKLAFVSFGRTGLFPPSDSSKNPFLYFYNNRRLFFNQRQSENQDDKTEESISLNFQEIIRQEVERLKFKYPRLAVHESYDFDVKVFRFEKFLRSIVRELLFNALEAMGSLKEPKLETSAKEEGDHFVFSVRDYGTGILNGDYKKPFRMYYSTKSQLGAGLNLIQNIVQANEGSIEMSSPDGGGLKVCIRLPLKCFLKNYFEKQEVSEK